MFNKNEETLKKLQERLNFQRLHLNLFLDILVKKTSEVKSKITSKSKLLAVRRQELDAVNHSIEKIGMKLKQLEETVERMKSKEVVGGGGRRALELKWQGGGRGEGGAVEPRQKVHRPHWEARESRREALPQFKLF